jgi:hypothetical protein
MNIFQKTFGYIANNLRNRPPRQIKAPINPVQNPTTPTIPMFGNFRRPYVGTQPQRLTDTHNLPPTGNRE